MKKILNIMVLIFLSANLFGQYEIPVRDGNWWKIAEEKPNITPYTYISDLNTCDFTIFKAKNNKWYLIACVRGHTYPGTNRILYRWEADSLTQVNWTPLGIFWTTGITVADGAPDAIGRTFGVSTPYTYYGGLQAPHCIIENGKYYLFHNNGGSAYALVSDDGYTWNQWGYLKDYTDSYQLFGMGRDVMIFDDRPKSGKWIAYYAGSWVVPARTADSLRGPWSAEIPEVSENVDNCESPFIIRRGDDYYLWEQLAVRHSKDPINFPGWPITNMYPWWGGDKFAPEILYENGQYYVAGYAAGVYIAKFKWVSAADPSVNCYLKSLSVKEGAFTTTFDSLLNSYTVYVKNNVTSLTIDAQTCNPSATYSFKYNSGFIVGENTVDITVTSSNVLNHRPYSIKVIRKTVGQTHLEVMSGSGTGDYANGSKVQINANTPPAGKFWDRWIGDVSFLDNPLSKSAMATLTDSNIVIRAQFREPASVTLTVNKGTGSGTFIEGDSASVSANAAHTDSVFLTWAGDVKYLGNPILPNTKIYIPNKNIKITATYMAKTTAVYALTVVNGSGSGNYPAGLIVSVNANAAPVGKDFLKWSTSIIIEDSLASSTFVTMPASAAQVQAIYYNTSGQDRIVSYVKTLLTDVLTWRSTSVAKPDDIDGDNAYGTSGYHMFSVEKKSLPAFVSTATLGANILAVSTGGTRLFDDPALAIAATVADYTPGKLDINIADALEGEFVRFKMKENASFRMGILSGHANNENCDSVRVAIGSVTTAKIAISNSAAQLTLFDITANAGDEVIIYGKTRNTGQTRNGIVGIAFDKNTTSAKNISFIVKNASGTVIQGVEVILTPYDTLSTNSSGFVTFTNVASPALLKYTVSATGYNTCIDGVNVGSKDDTVNITLYTTVLYTLTVNSGSGSGSYSSGKVILINASAPPANKVFDKWTGDVAGIDDINASLTNLTMPAGNIAITATYKDVINYTLTVNSGTGSGSYPAGTVVTITASTPAAGKLFDKWTGDVTGILNMNNATTTIAMPAANANITATYKDAPITTYTLTVTSGTGSGSYAQGAKVTVAANAAAAGKIFDKWTVDVSYLKNETDSVNDITMPAKNISITATYKDKPNSISDIRNLIRIYPNPANEYVNIASSENLNGSFNIINFSGITVIERNIQSNAIETDISGLAKGIYIIRIISEGEIIFRTLVIQ